MGSSPVGVTNPHKFVQKGLSPMKSFFGEQCSYTLEEEILSIELANTDHIKMIFFKARELVNVGPVGQCT